MPKTTFPARPGKPRISSEKPEGNSAALLRFWSFMLFLGAGVLLTILMATLVVVRNRSHSSEEPEEIASSEIKPLPLPPTPAPPTVPIPKKRELLPETKKPLPMPVIKLDAKQPAVPNAEDTQKMDLLLETTGSLAAIHLYQCHLNIGLLADAVEKETYTKAEAERILGTIQLLLSTMEEQLAKLESANLEAEDKQAIAKVHGIADQLKRQAKSLQNYWTEEEKKEIDQYHETREKTWNELKLLLGLPEEKAS